MPAANRRLACAHAKKGRPLRHVRAGEAYIEKKGKKGGERMYIIFVGDGEICREEFCRWMEQVWSRGA